MTIQEINNRLAQIEAELQTAEGEAKNVLLFERLKLRGDLNIAKTFGEKSLAEAQDEDSNGMLEMFEALAKEENEDDDNEGFDFLAEFSKIDRTNW